MLNKRASISLIAMAITASAFSSNASSQDFIAPPMVAIPAGQFMMGNAGGDPAATPIHEVSVDTFQMSKYTVTVAEFRKFVEDTGFFRESTCNDHIDEHGLRSPRFIGTGRWDYHQASYSEYQPIVCISWADANAYAKWLSEKTGITYRLPTEQEWEYAAKANTTTRFYWGDDPNGTQACKYGNFADETGEYVNNKRYGYTNIGWVEHLSCDDGEAYNAMVGLYRPNAFGLYDMLGNVSEFVDACYDNSGYHVSLGEDQDTQTCEFIAHRGGNWHYPAQPATTRGRLKREGWNVGSDTGFRLAADGLDIKKHSSTNAFEVNLKQAQKAHLAERESLLLAPKSALVSHLKGNQYQLSWSSSEDNRVTHYDIYASKSPLSHFYGGLYTKHYEKLNRVSEKTRSINVMLPEGGGSFRVVAVSNSQKSLPSNKAIALAAPTVTTLPGRFDMRVVARLDNIPLHHRKKKGDKTEAFILSKVNKNSDKRQVSATFKVNVEAAGWYHLNYHGRTFHKGEFFKLWQGNDLIAVIDFDPELDDKISSRHKVYLEQGEQDIQLSVLRDRFDIWDLSWLEFTKVEKS